MEKTLLTYLQSNVVRLGGQIVDQSTLEPDFI